MRAYRGLLPTKQVIKCPAAYVHLGGIRGWAAASVFCKCVTSCPCRLLLLLLLPPQELRSEVEAMDARGTRGEGPRLVAHAWLDPEFKARLLQVRLLLRSQAFVTRLTLGCSSL